jgi:hypothetical protein
LARDVRPRPTLTAAAAAITIGPMSAQPLKPATTTTTTKATAAPTRTGPRSTRAPAAVQPT